MTEDSQSVLAIDFGSQRLGLAIARLASRLARPLTTLQVTENLIKELEKLIDKEDVAFIVIGYPRGLNGQKTNQTDKVEQFVDKLKQQIYLPIYLQDEALTSIKAEEELQKRHKPYERQAIDALAATYILEDWFKEHKS